MPRSISDEATIGDSYIYIRRQENPQDIANNISIKYIEGSQVMLSINYNYFNIKKMKRSQSSVPPPTAPPLPPPTEARPPSKSGNEKKKKRQFAARPNSQTLLWVFEACTWRARGVRREGREGGGTCPGRARVEQGRRPGWRVSGAPGWPPRHCQHDHTPAPWGSPHHAGPANHLVLPNFIFANCPGFLVQQGKGGI